MNVILSTPEVAHQYLLSIWPEPLDFREIVIVVFLDPNYRVIGTQTMFLGGRFHCPVDPFVIFRNSLKFGASNIIIAHNHVSGNSMASPSDKDSSEAIIKAAKLISIGVAQMVITRSDFTVLSFF